VDIFTHAVLPLAAFALLRRPLAERLAAGLGAAMPDMDVLFSWLTRLADPLYAFTHRGWSHSLWGAPLLAVVGLVVLTRPWWGTRWPRLRAFRLEPLTLVAAGVGALSHIALDFLTISGIPLLWPWSTARFTVNLFFFSVLLMTPVSAWAIWRLSRGTLTDALLRRAAAVLVVLLLTTGAVRAATMPTPPPEGIVQPAFLEVQWYTAAPIAGGWSVAMRAPWGDAGPRAWVGNATPEASDAVARAQGLGAYIAWHWTNPAPVVNATELTDGWRVEFRDAVAMERAETGGSFAGLIRPLEPLVVEVVHGDARAVQNPAFFGFG
jgi:membrane-bound metal-dependent hydrolase YbcI (DUF457 family)